MGEKNLHSFYFMLSPKELSRKTSAVVSPRLKSNLPNENGTKKIDINDFPSLNNQTNKLTS